MFNNLTALGYGIIVFGIVVGVGTIILYNFSQATDCTSTYTYNSSADNCYLTTNSSVTATKSTSSTSVDYLLGQMGQSGLAGWTPAIIAISVGILFLGAFMIGKGGKGRY